MRNAQKSRLVSHLIDNVGKPLNTATINQIAGSSEGTRRVRELREEGFKIRTEQQGRNWFYTLTRKPAQSLIKQYL